MYVCGFGVIIIDIVNALFLPYLRDTQFVYCSQDVGDQLVTGLTINVAMRKLQKLA